MSLPKNAKGQQDSWSFKPSWAHRRYWPEDLPEDGPVTLVIDQINRDWFDGHTHWLIDVRWGQEWACYHDARELRSVVETAQRECISEMRGHRARTVRVRRIR